MSGGATPLRACRKSNAECAVGFVLGSDRMGNAGRDEAFPARASRRMTVKDTAATLLRPRDIDGFDLCCLLPFWLRSPGLCHSFFSALLPSRSPASARA